IADVLVEAFLCVGRRFERERAVRAEIQRPVACAWRRPAGVLPPDVGAGLEHVRLWELGVRGAPEVLLEERKHDPLPVEVAGLRSERHPPQPLAVEASPAAMDPRTLDERDRRRRVVAGYRVECPERSAELPRVGPTAYHEDRTRDVAHVPREI